MYRRVTSPIEALTHEGFFFTILAGAIVQTADDMDEPGLQVLLLDDEEFLVFRGDIHSCTERCRNPVKKRAAPWVPAQPKKSAS